MTCIVGLIKDGQVCLGADSLQVSDGVKIIRKSSKIQRRTVMDEAQGEHSILIGGCGSDTDILLTHHALPFPAMGVGEDAFLYLFLKLAPALRALMKERGNLRQKDSQQVMDAVLMIAFRNRLFVLHSDFGVEEGTVPYRALGSGEDAAMGALYCAEQFGLRGAQAVLIALQAAASVATTVAEPFSIYLL